MTFKQLAMEICRREGKKRQVDIAQVYEILKCLAQIIVEQHLPKELSDIPPLKKKRSKKK